MKRLYLVRHGESEMNVQQLFAGRIETPLTDTGRAQAKETGKQAVDLGIEYIVCSPLERAHETAKIIAKEIGYKLADIHVNSLFVERNFGALEGTPWSMDVNFDGVIDLEGDNALLDRARLALDFLETLPYDTILVVTHGAFGRALRHHTREDFPFSHPQKIKNAELIQLV